LPEQNKTKTIRVSANTLKMLGKERDGFETPDECLQRILSKQGEKDDNNVDVDDKK